MPSRYFTGLLYRYAVGYGAYAGEPQYLMVSHALVHAGCSGSLHTPYLHFRIELLDGKSHAAGQSAAAYGHDDHLHVGQLLQQLQAYGALSGYHVLIIEGVDEGIAPLVAQVQRPLVGIVIHSGHQTDVGAIAACGLHLADGRSVGQADETLDAMATGTQRNPLRVVSCRAGYHSVLLFFIGQAGYLVTGTAHLERACQLQVLGLQVYVGLGIEAGSLHQVGAAYDAAQRVTRFIEVVEVQHRAGICLSNSFRNTQNFSTEGMLHRSLGV